MPYDFYLLKNTLCSNVEQELNSINESTYWLWKEVPSMDKIRVYKIVDSKTADLRLSEIVRICNTLGLDLIECLGLDDKKK